MPRPGRRTWIALGTLAALVLWAMTAWDGWTYSEAAAHYRLYAQTYEEPEADRKYYVTCYGEVWDGYMEKVQEDRVSRQGDKPYLASRAAYYRQLQAKYERAAARPWPWLRFKLDPPLRP